MRRGDMQNLSEIVKLVDWVRPSAGHVVGMPESNQACKWCHELATRNRQKIKRQNTEDLADDWI